ncbi:MAG TPA: signal recognition particle protein [Gammaproteobacteria bacterium]|jgi:signal recognition particle subunit SRP54|nr:signal recognition particle protein [Gammaproteobacteria bacterium]
MFKALSERLSRTLDAVRGSGRMTEQNIRDALRDVRLALLEADVALPVVQAFTESARIRALGADVLKSLTPGQAFIKVVHEELLRTMGEAAPLDLNAAPPVVILLAGLQGAGKTTTAAKLARHLVHRERKKVLLVSTDVYRPAAREQLERLAGPAGAMYFPSTSDDPVAIATAALTEARARLYDVLIVDTAGRQHVDAELMEEARRIHAAVAPRETLFVIDAMAGQDAAKAATEFGQALPLTGAILTKADGDARGGAALSVRQVTGVPIKFMGVGEDSSALEVFQPERVVSRILGMGDVLALVEQAEQNLDREKGAELVNKLKSGKRFDLMDLRAQLEQVLAMGGVGAMLDKLPGGAAMAGKTQGQFGERELKHQIAIINSMTPKERAKPDVINGSRRRRIAQGSGTQVQEVNRLLKQYDQIAQVMKQMAGGGMAKMLRGMKGRLPPGFGPR